MGNHTIGNKRGSVRGAPPDAYMGFMSVDTGDDPEAWQEAFRIIKAIGLGAAIWIVICVSFLVLWATGLLPGDPLG